MHFDFALVLVIGIAITGVLTLIDKVFFLKRRRARAAAVQTEAEKAACLKTPLLIEYAQSFFPILLVVLLLRSFLVEPFRIPSGSLKPTLLVGDFILVNKYTYGLRMPVVNNKFYSLNEPKRGDIVVFRWPVDESVDYIKRVVGLPGDHIRYHDKVLTINGQEATQKIVGFTTDIDDNGDARKVEKRLETINGITHPVFVNPQANPVDFEVDVPAGQYFMMGDNRDASSDSRYWGFVPEKNLIGHAFLVFFSKDNYQSWFDLKQKIRWDRLGESVT